MPSAATAPGSAQPPSDPTPLAKCQVAASSTSPLVTEWPASEKAHLQSLTAGRVVAVEYAGCELRIVDSCVLSGGYDWRRTTLATDVVEIDNADELYAKLPIGAVALEGELARSGRLAVRSTVAGQLQSKALDAKELAGAGCRGATHYVSGISVGAFQLLSGAEVAGKGGVDVLGASAGAGAKRREVVLREAGSREACAETTDEAPPMQCASPIQLFLTALPQSAEATPERIEDPGAAAAVNVAFPAPENSDEVWTLRAPGGRVICTLPCAAPVGPVSGKYLQREPRNGYGSYLLQLPQSFAHPVGSKVKAEYQAERGNPTLARWAFIGSIPMGVMGVGLTSWGIVQATRTCEDEFSHQTEDCFPPGGFLIGSGVFMMAMFGGAAWWHFYSHDQEFNTYEELAGTRRAKGDRVRLALSPAGLRGSF